MKTPHAGDDANRMELATAQYVPSVVVRELDDMMGGIVSILIAVSVTVTVNALAAAPIVLLALITSAYVSFRNFGLMKRVLAVMEAEFTGLDASVYVVPNVKWSPRSTGIFRQDAAVIAKDAEPVSTGAVDGALSVTWIVSGCAHVPAVLLPVTCKLYDVFRYAGVTVNMLESS